MARPMSEDSAALGIPEPSRGAGAPVRGRDETIITATLVAITFAVIWFALPMLHARDRV